MKKLNIIIFVAILLIFGIGNIVTPKDQTISHTEKRALVMKPVKDPKLIFSGDYSKQYDNYFADHFVFREAFIDLSSKLKAYRGFETKDELQVFVATGNNMDEESETVDNGDDPVDETEDNQRPSGQDSVDDNQNKPEDVEGFNTTFGLIYVQNKIAFEQHLNDPLAVEGYADALNYFANQVSAKCYSMQIPTQAEFLNLPEGASYPQINTLNLLEEHYSEKVEAVDVYSNLDKHKDEYIYMATDHHWTAYGAYYAYEAFMKQKGETPVAIDTFEVETADDFLGTLYGQTKSEELIENPDTVYFFKPQVDYEFYEYESEKGIPIELYDYSFVENGQHYGAYLSGDARLQILKTDVDNGKKIIIIKDSYANAMIPFFTSHYEEIHIIDPRFYETELVSYINDHDIDEVVFFNYVLVHRYGGYIEYYNNLSGRNN